MKNRLSIASLSGLIALLCCWTSIAAAQQGYPDTREPPVDGTPGILGFSASTYNAAENSGSAIITVTRTGGSSGHVSINFSTADGTALANQDYLPNSGTLSWNNGESGPKTFTVGLIDDAEDAASVTASLSLNTATGGAVTAVTSAILIIVDDDEPTPEPSRPEGLLSSVARNPVQLEIANTLDTINAVNTATPALQGVIDGLVTNLKTDPSGVANALQQIAPEEIGAQSTLSLEASAAQFRNIYSRLYALREGASCIDGSGLKLNVNGQIMSASPLFFTPDELCNCQGRNPGNINEMSRWGLFVNGNISTGDADETSRSSGFDFDTGGVTIGLDYRYSPSLVVGGAVGFVHTEADMSHNTGNIELDGYNLSLYGTLYERNKFFLDAIYTYGTQSFDNVRNIAFNVPGLAVDQQSNSSNDGSYHALSLGYGLNLHYVGYTLTPEIRFDYVNLNLDGFSETLSSPDKAGGALGVRIEDQEVDSMTLRLGGRLAYSVVNDESTFMPYAKAFFVHEFEDDLRLVKGSFLGDTANHRFSLASDDIDSNYGELGLGMLYEFMPGRMIYLDYTTVISLSRINWHAVTMGLRWSF